MSVDSDDSGISLDDYVKETLLAIVKGVLAAQKDVDAGEYIGRAPIGPTEHLNVASDAQGNTISLVRFDLATTHDNRRGGGIAVVPILGLGGGVKSEVAASLVNRIGFVVAISVPKPMSQVLSDEDRRRKDHAAMERARAGTSWKTA